MLNCIAVGLGGFVGSVLRYLIGQIKIDEAFAFPIKTLAINIIGAFAIGIITAMCLRQSSFDARTVLFLKVGVCGGFTTFSTFALESVNLMQSGRGALAVLYMVLSVVLSVAAVMLAEMLVK